jgi:hypothetical protein
MAKTDLFSKTRGALSDDEELDKALRAFILTLQNRADEPEFADPNAILQRSFPQPPASSFRPTSGRFGQNNAIFSNVSAVPSKDQRRLANVGAAILNVIKAAQAAKKTKPPKKAPKKDLSLGSPTLGQGGGGGTGRNISEILGRI